MWYNSVDTTIINGNIIMENKKLNVNIDVDLLRDKINDIIIFTENELFLAKNETFVSVFNLIATGDSFCKNLFFFSEIISFPLPKKKRECTIQYVGWSSDCEVLGFSNRGALRNHVFECCGALAFRLSSVLFSGKQAPLIFGIRFGF